jgi:hypothetical protein
VTKKSPNSEKKQPINKKKNNPFMVSVKAQENLKSDLFNDLIKKDNKSLFSPQNPKTESSMNLTPTSHKTNLNSSSTTNSSIFQSVSPLSTTSSLFLKKNEMQMNSDNNTIYPNTQNPNLQNQYIAEKPKPSFLSRSNTEQNPMASNSSGQFGNTQSGGISSLSSLVNNYQKSNQGLFFQSENPNSSNANKIKSMSQGSNINSKWNNSFMGAINKRNQYNTNTTNYGTGNNISFNNSSGFDNKYSRVTENRNQRFGSSNNNNSFLGSNNFLSRNNNMQSIKNENSIDNEIGGRSNTWNRDNTRDFQINIENKSNVFGSNRTNRILDIGNLSPIGKTSKNLSFLKNLLNPNS